MKKVAVIFLFSIFFLSFSCKKDKKKELPATIYISGTVTDKQTATPLDSVSVSLDYESIGSVYYIPLMSSYTAADGKFNFQFSPQEDNIYKLSFTKKNYNSSYQYIDKYKEFQSYNVALEK